MKLFLMLISGAAENIGAVAVVDFELNGAVSYFEFCEEHCVDLHN
jgi:hypothetical protein